MTYPIGSTAPLPVSIYGADGVTLTDPTMLTITVIPPNQVPIVYTYPGTITRISVGQFIVYHPITLKGLHGWMSASTGPSTAYGPDSFYGNDASIVPVVGLADVRQQLRSFSTASDAQLLAWAVTATVLAEQYTNLVWSTRSFTETHQGGGSTLSLYRLPVQSITTVIEDGTTLATTNGADWTLDDFGILYRGPLRSPGQVWQSNFSPVKVTYIAGPDNGAVPANIRQGVLEMCQHLALPVRNGSGRPGQGGGANDTLWAPGMTFPIPRRVAGFWDGSQGSGL